MFWRLWSELFINDINKVGQTVLTFGRADYNLHICVGFKGVRSFVGSIIDFYLTFLVTLLRLC